MQPDKNLIPFPSERRGFPRKFTLQPEVTEQDYLKNFDVENIEFKELNWPLTNAQIDLMEMKGGEEVADQVSRHEFDSFKTQIELQQKYSEDIVTEKINRVNDKIDHGNTILSEKISSSQAEVLYKINLMQSELNSKIELLESNFKQDMSSKFDEERKKRDKETVDTRRFLIGISVAVAVGLIPVLQSFFS